MSRYTYIPLIRKLTYSKDVLVERALPNTGQIMVKEGDTVEPSQKLGSCKVSYDVVDLGKEFKVKDKNKVSFLQGENVGKAGSTKFEAPFNGSLEKSENGYFYKSEEKDFWLLPGVWGQVSDISHNRSILIKTQFVNVHMPITTKIFKAGELVVFPNPSEILSVNYFANYVKNSFGKIVYVGNNLTLELINKAHELKIEAIIAGSASKDVYDFAVKNDIALGLLSAFGDQSSPEFIYTFLNEINSRYVFFYGDKNILQVPVTFKNPYSNIIPVKSILKPIRKGLRVQLFDNDHFGRFGIVDRVSKSSIFVTLPEKSDLLEIKTPNLIAIE